MYWDRYDYYKPTRPKSVKCGIKLQSVPGKIIQKWWAKKWIAVLESFNISKRLGRGRAYARSGQVVSVEINKGNVTAKVQGSRAKPYSVKISVKTLLEDDWKKIAGELTKQTIFVSKLLAGEMPENIEDVFKKIGLSLFPEKASDLNTDCSCPDWSNPCKHIAAVYYLLGEEFARDPFLIFKLRGLEREELIRLMGCGTSQAPQKKHDGGISEKQLPSGPDTFWGKEPKCDLSEEALIPSIPAALPARLGKFPFWRGNENLQETLKDIYNKASLAGMSIFLGEK